MAVAADEFTFIRPNLFKVFSRTAQGDGTFHSLKFNMSRFKKLVLWIKMSTVVGGPPTWTVTLNHVVPQSTTEPVPAGDKIAHATTLARANAGISRQQYGDVGSAAALPEAIGDLSLQCVASGGGTCTGEVWIEGIE